MPGDRWHLSPWHPVASETLLKPERLLNTCSDDCYIVSQFGLMDAILDEKLGFTPKREEGEILLMGKGNVIDN